MAIELREIQYDGKKRIELQDRVYSIKDNPIGVREKFWLVRRGGKLPINESPVVTDMLFKYNRNDVSSEDLGEVVACRLMRMCGLKSVEYYLAELTKLDGSKVDGVLCGSFKKTLSEIETSAYTLQTSYTKFAFDPETGKSEKEINTVEGLVDDLRSVYGYNQLDDIILTDIRNELMKQCLMDFVMAQTDRHWLNTSFLEFMYDGQYHIKKAKCYDNGCIAFLKRKKQAILTINNQIKGQYLTSPRMKELMEGYVPMFGVKTSTVLIDVDRFNKVGIPEKLKINPEKGVKHVFLDELTQEILTNGEMACFYKDMLETLGYNSKYRSIDKKKIFDRVERYGDTIDEQTKEMIFGVMTYQINEIQTLLDKKLDFYRIHRDDSEEYHDKD